MSVGADVVDWTAAIAGVIGAAAAVVALWAVFKRFRLDLQARIDPRRQAIRLDVENKGREKGLVQDVAVVDSQMIDQGATFAGLKDDRFNAAELPGHSSWCLVLRADRDKGPFGEDVRVLVKPGKGKERSLVPEPVDGASYYGLESSWPSGPS